MPMEKIIQQLDEGLPDLHEAKIVQGTNLPRLRGVRARALAMAGHGKVRVVGTPRCQPRLLVHRGAHAQVTFANFYARLHVVVRLSRVQQPVPS